LKKIFLSSLLTAEVCTLIVCLILVFLFTGKIVILLIPAAAAVCLFFIIDIVLGKLHGGKKHKTGE